MTQTQAINLPVKPENIAQFLKDRNQWIGWKIGKSKPDGRYEKLPVNRYGVVCNAHDSKNHMTFDEAVALNTEGIFSGIGFVLDGNPISIEGEEFYIVGIDIDHCVKDFNYGSPLISALAEEAWKFLGQPYFEISPSGTGIRMFVLSKHPIKAGNRDGKEMYMAGRFLTVTGQGKGEVKEATSAVASINAEWFPEKYTKKTTPSHKFALNSYANNESSTEIEKVRSALSFIPANCDYDTWRNLVWAIKSSGWDCAEILAREWSESEPNSFTEDGFVRVWNSFDPEGGISLGTLFYHAQSEGWQLPGAPSEDDSEGDILNGKLFADKYRAKYIFIHETAQMLKFTSAGWVHAPPGEAESAAKGIVKQLKTEATQAYMRDPSSGETKRKMAHATRSSMEPRLNAMISLARSELGMTVRLSSFDVDVDLLGVINGVLNLKTSQLLLPTPDLLVSMRASVAFEVSAKCPTWVSFLNTVQPDKSVQRLLQQLTGVFLTGSSSLQKLIFIYGLGANGKSTYIEVISWLLGDYSLRIATEMLMHYQRSPQAPSPDIVALKGRRLAYCNEVAEGKCLDEARVKELTGGDTLTGRTPYAKQNVTFQPTHNIVMVGNHKIEVRDTGHGMWRRMLLIPFEVTIPPNMQDRHLLEKLKHEGSGILNWAMAGLRDFEKVGLRIPKVITSATDAYKDEEDILGEWLQDHFSSIPGAKVSIADCYSSYRFWADSRGHKPFAQSRLTKRLKERGFNRDGGKRNYQGLELNDAGQAATRVYMH
jgi:putative DNA primase/helicase